MITFVRIAAYALGAGPLADCDMNKVTATARVELESPASDHVAKAVRSHASFQRIYRRAHWVHLATCCYLIVMPSR